MPNPKDFEDKDKFISACVSQRIDEGSDESEEQSLAICYSLWDEQDAPAEKRALTSAILRARSVLKSNNHWEDQERDSSGRFGSGDGGSDKPSSGKPGKNPKDKPDKRNAISSMEYEALTHELGMPTDMVDEFIAENPEASFEDAVAHFYDLGSIQDYEIARIVNEERGNSLDTATYEALAERLGVDLNATEDDAYGNSEDEDLNGYADQFNADTAQDAYSFVEALESEDDPADAFDPNQAGQIAELLSIARDSGDPAIEDAISDWNTQGEILRDEHGVEDFPFITEDMSGAAPYYNPEGSTSDFASFDSESNTGSSDPVEAFSAEVSPPPGYSGVETGLTGPLQYWEGSLGNATDAELRDAANSMAYQLALNAAHAHQELSNPESWNYDPDLRADRPPSLADSLFLEGFPASSHGDWSEAMSYAEQGDKDIREAMRLADRLLNQRTNQPESWIDFADQARQAIQQALEAARDLARNPNKKPPKKSFEDLRTKLAVMKAKQLLKDI